jgi:hypothetical protein
MKELTPRLVLELGGSRYRRARVLALADSDGVGIAVIDVDGDGARVVVEHYIQDDGGTWRVLRRAGPLCAETASEGPGPGDGRGKGQSVAGPVYCVWGRIPDAGPAVLAIRSADTTAMVEAGWEGWWAWAGRTDRTDHHRR